MVYIFNRAVSEQFQSDLEVNFKLVEPISELAIELIERSFRAVWKKSVAVALIWLQSRAVPGRSWNSFRSVPERVFIELLKSASSLLQKIMAAAWNRFQSKFRASLGQFQSSIRSIIARHWNIFRGISDQFQKDYKKKIQSNFGENFSTTPEWFQCNVTSAGSITEQLCEFQGNFPI